MRRVEDTDFLETPRRVARSFRPVGFSALGSPAPRRRGTGPRGSTPALASTVRPDHHFSKRSARLGPVIGPRHRDRTGAEIKGPGRSRHGRGAFPTETRGGQSQWYGGRLGRLYPWGGPASPAAPSSRPRRPDLESLESRELLTAGLDLAVSSPIASSVSLLSPQPAASGAASPVVSGAVRRRDRGRGRPSGLRRRRQGDDGRPDRHRDQLRSRGPRRGPRRGYKVVAGYDFADNDADPMGTSQHGTAVAGLLASSDPSHLGVAPGADLAALRVFNGNGQGDFNKVAQALQWVIDHHDAYQHHGRQPVAGRRGQLRPQLVRAGRRDRPADHRPDQPARQT